MVQTRAAGIFLSDSDYMFGVSDYMRMGGLCLSHSHTPNVFLAEHTNISKLIHMWQLEIATRHFESGIGTAAG